MKIAIINLRSPLVFRLLIFVVAGISMAANARNKSGDKLLYTDNFDQNLNNWRAEFEQPNTSSVRVVDSKLDLSSSRGATVWFNNKLTGNIMITYEVMLIDAGGANDRVSDLNAFWMATDPATDQIPSRNGKFDSYDNLNLYYAGVGGHYNQYTRFRKYHSDGVKPVLKEYTDAAHLLQGNKLYQVKIVVKNGRVQYFLNNELLWDFMDEKPYTTGYFGFRTTISHQQIDNFRVYQLP